MAVSSGRPTSRYPLVWLVSLPFRLLGMGMTLEVAFETLKAALFLPAVLFLPARMLGARRA